MPPCRQLQRGRKQSCFSPGRAHCSPEHAGRLSVLFARHSRLPSQNIRPAVRQPGVQAPTSCLLAARPWLRAGRVYSVAQQLRGPWRSGLPSALQFARCRNPCCGIWQFPRPGNVRTPYAQGGVRQPVFHCFRGFSNRATPVRQSPVLLRVRSPETSELTPEGGGSGTLRALPQLYNKEPNTCRIIPLPMPTGRPT